MTDPPEPSSRRCQNDSAAAPPLQYPTFPPLSASVEEWLSRSRPINMTSNLPTTDQTSRSLSEGWATMSVSDIYSEDGTRSEQTDMGSLIDQTGPDDVASLDETSSNSEIDASDDDGYYGENYESTSNVSATQELSSGFPFLGTSIDNSSLTTQTAFRQSTESIEFAEPESWPETERVELKHTIRVFEGLEAAALKQKLSNATQDSTLTATVQQTMTRRSLDTDKPFRVLYIGSPDFRNLILDKIGDVLVASSPCSSYESSSTESSRYHVVPTSFGAGAIPNFAELLPIHVQLIVDECLDASADSQTDKPSTITLSLKNQPPYTSKWVGADYCISSPVEWTLPDIAIIFLATTDSNKDTETQRLARIFLERHGVPTMEISERPLWTMSRDPVPVNRHSLHMCLESRDPVTGTSTLVNRYPIDIKTFESIAPRQLNRNLASLATIYPRKVYQVPPECPNEPLVKRALNAVEHTWKVTPIPFSNGNHKLAFLLRLTVLFAAAVLTITFGHFALRALILFLTQYFAHSGVSSAVTTQSQNIPTASGFGPDGLLTVVPSNIADVQAQRAQAHGRSSLEDFMDGILSPNPPSEGPSEFEFQVVGDCHLAIKPPHKSFIGRKGPRFSVQVKRDGKPLDYELSTLFEGVYTLKLERADAYGLVDVIITSNTRPPFTQTTSVDFGTPWLKIQKWRRAAHAISSQFLKEFGSAQTGLSEAYERICTDLQVLMGDVVKKAHFLRREASALHDSVQLSHDTKELVLSKSAQLTQVVKRTAVQPLLAASAAFQGHTERVNRGAREVMSGTWNRISASAQVLDLTSMKTHIRNARKCQTLNKAQQRARSLMKRKTCRQTRCAK
ncbi:uncharacterized protein BO95DRAFT_447947 [Aspergillus brunneoviolaceus CBS 621.78]|uniref:Uncharacterized protein n=1 Tax=Aspergillus brunneoviolaceus CBS 621.78 TaxID=1450534 RepID=A0ACD1FTY4_9EURO|nr:hypothetical protein BO95DRAFT_447947 [Aspergillus brunneoviolaceus CBS 621.78]RAH40396.1 hypothetical protein BO95DRAFT_447947 [Aspergillus brunneoviolaceus CBS 621.78]